eukprot:2261198-Lingulodinium_polyedra.AAC.1
MSDVMFGRGVVAHVCCRSTFPARPALTSVDQQPTTTPTTTNTATYVGGVYRRPGKPTGGPTEEIGELIGGRG